MFTCEYCKNTFTSNYNLGTHQKNAKYCLCIQNGSKLNKILVCDGCDKSFKSKVGIDKHMDKCIEYNIKISEKVLKENHKETIDTLEGQIQEFKETIKEKDEYIKEILMNAMNKINVNNNNNNSTNNSTNSININNIPNITDEVIAKLRDGLNSDIIMNSGEKFGKYCSKNINKSAWYKDKARNNIVYKRDNVFIEDKSGDKLTVFIFSEVKDKASEIINVELQKGVKMYLNALDNNGNLNKCQKDIEHISTRQTVFTNITKSKDDKDTKTFLGSFKKGFVGGFKKVPLEISGNMIEFDSETLQIVDSEEVEDEEESSDARYDRREKRKFAVIRNKVVEILQDKGYVDFEYEDVDYNDNSDYEVEVDVEKIIKDGKFDIEFIADNYKLYYDKPHDDILYACSQFN